MAISIPKVMEQPSQAGLQASATAASDAHAVMPRTTFARDEHPGNGYASIVVLSRPLGPASRHWAIAVITDEQTRRARVYHLSDHHVQFSPGQTVRAQDEDLNGASGYEGGVRIGTVFSAHLRTFESFIHSCQLPPADASGRRSCKDWMLYVIRHLERHTFRLSTPTLRDEILLNTLISHIQFAVEKRIEFRSSSPVFVTLSEPRR